VAVEEEKEKAGLFEELRKHGLSETAVTNVAKFYP
jgi:hypothetical protein